MIKKTKNTQKNIKMTKKIKNQIQLNKKQNKKANIVNRTKIIKIKLKGPNNIVKMMATIMKAEAVKKMEVEAEKMNRKEEKKEN